jgi:hypothetical protein
VNGWLPMLTWLLPDLVLPDSPWRVTVRYMPVPTFLNDHEPAALLGQHLVAAVAALAEGQLGDWAVVQFGELLVAGVHLAGLRRACAQPGQGRRLAGAGQRVGFGALPAAGADRPAMRSTARTSRSASHASPVS